MIHVKNISKSFNGKKLMKNLSVNFNCGTTQLQGSNGVGKSTLLMILSGLEKEDSGEIIFKNIHNRWKDISLSSEAIHEPNVFSLNEIFTLFHQYNQVNPYIFNKLIKQFDLKKFLDIKIGEVSTGTRKKVSLINAFSKESKILLLDEPFNGLDKEARDALIEIISFDKRDKIIIDHENILNYEHLIELERMDD